ncbi:microsomal epoxide hydrolase [Xylaria longipes]|nr:microsomal epoxide hydrolase [Xylaria longipes]
MASLFRLWKTVRRRVKDVHLTRLYHQISSTNPFKIAIPDSDLANLKERLLHTRYQYELKNVSIERGVPLADPGSFLEGTKVIAPLAEGTPAFDIVIPSLPNFGFSDGISKLGFSVDQQAEVLHKLIFPSFWETPSLFLKSMLTLFTPKEKVGLEKIGRFFTEGNGYGAIQSTYPKTLGYGLTVSPVGLLAWVYEKLHDCADECPWTEDEICTSVSIYWFSTASPAASTRLYYGFQQDIITTIERFRGWMDVKLGFGQFPNDLGPTVFQREHPDRGHFPTWEKPSGGAEGVVKVFRQN